MTYTAYETSVSDGQPVELYEFLNGATYYRYTSADGDVTYGGNTYTAVPIARGAVEATSETARLALEITCARTVGVLDLFALMPPAERRKRQAHSSRARRRGRRGVNQPVGVQAPATQLQYGRIMKTLTANQLLDHLLDLKLKRFNLDLVEIHVTHPSDFISVPANQVESKMIQGRNCLVIGQKAE
jgi:hypothetical protein